MSRTVKALLLAASCCLAAGAARADVIYTATTPASSAASGPFVHSFDLTNAQVATGSFNLTVRGGGREGSYEAEPATFSGDVNGFNSLNFALDDSIVPGGYLFGTLQASLTFDPNTDALNTIDVNFAGADTDAAITGTGSNALLRFASDDPYLCPSESSGSTMTCNLGLSFVASVTPPGSVPEPATSVVLGAGLLGLGAARRQRADRSAGEA